MRGNDKDNIVRFPTTEISCVIYFTFFRDRFFYLVQIKFELGGGKKLKALWCRNENWGWSKRVIQHISYDKKPPCDPHDPQKSKADLETH